MPALLRPCLHAELEPPISWRLFQDARSRQLQLVAVAAAEAAQLEHGGGELPADRCGVWEAGRQARGDGPDCPAACCCSCAAGVCLHCKHAHPAAPALPPRSFSIVCRLGEGEVVLHVALHVPHAPHLVSEEWLVLGSQVG